MFGPLKFPRFRHCCSGASAVGALDCISPAIASGRLYLRLGDAIACYDLTGAAPPANPMKQGGRTRTLYVPMELVAEVKQWTLNYRHLKRLIRQVTRHSRALIHGHRANRRAASRSRALTSPSPLKSS